MQVLIFISLFIFLFFLSRELTKSISSLLYRGFGENRFSFHFFHLLFLPGVIVHELAHFLSAELMLVKTGSFNLMPRREGDMVIMGSVGIQKTDPFRRAIIGFAPVLAGLIIIFSSVIYFLSSYSPLPVYLNFSILFLIIFQIGNTMFSSKKDLEGTLELLFIIGIFLIILYFIGVQIPYSFVEFFNSTSFNNIMKNANFILLIPIILDLIIIGIIKFIYKGVSI